MMNITNNTAMFYTDEQWDLLLEQVTPKNPSLQTQIKVSTLTSTHVAPLLHGELSQAVVHGAGR